MQVKALTPTMMQSGKRFVELLDAKKFNPKAAFWIYNPQQSEWQLLLGHVNGIEDDDAVFNKTVAAIVSAHQTQLPELGLTDIGLALENAPILELLNSLVNTGDELLGISFQNEEINGTVVDGVYLYRMNITEPAL
jgi:hypothetical protein